MSAKTPGQAGSITAVVLTLNEEDFIADCLASLRWCDAILVLDSLSTDRTVGIACQMNAAVVQRPFRNFADQRNAALDIIDTEWVFFVDADERITSESAAEVRAAIRDESKAGWLIPTHNYLRGRLTLRGGMYPDYHLRIFRRESGRYDSTQYVHEQVVLDGEMGILAHPLVHISCYTWREFMSHQNAWATAKARIQFERGVRPTYHLVLGPLVEFARRFIYLGGFREGVHGLSYSVIFSYYIFVMYGRLWQMWRVPDRGVKGT